MYIIFLSVYATLSIISSIQCIYSSNKRVSVDYVEHQEGYSYCFTNSVGNCQERNFYSNSHDKLNIFTKNSGQELGNDWVKLK